MIEKKTLSLDSAKRIAAAAADHARANGWPVAIAVVDEGANLLYFERLEGTMLGSIETSIGKARSSVLFKRPTKALEDIIIGGRNVMMNLPQAVPIQGGVPLTHEGNLIGGIGVSGVLSPQDEEVALAGAAIHVGREAL